MRHLRTFVVIVGLASNAIAGPTAYKVKRNCRALPADFDSRVEKATTARDAAFAKALAAKKLTPWTGNLQVFSLDNDDPFVPGLPPSSVKRPKGTRVDLGSSSNAELVADSKGTVYLVKRAPTFRGTHYVQCGCGPISGGAAERVGRYVGELPAGTSYGGEVTIKYTDTVPTTSWDRMNQGRPCGSAP